MLAIKQTLKKEQTMVEIVDKLRDIENSIDALDKDPVEDQTGQNMADCISYVGYQLTRIADALEKQEKK